MLRPLVHSRIWVDMESSKKKWLLGIIVVIAIILVSLLEEVRLAIISFFIGCPLLISIFFTKIKPIVSFPDFFYEISDWFIFFIYYLLIGIAATIIYTRTVKRDRNIAVFTIMFFLVQIISGVYYWNMMSSFADSFIRGIFS